MDLGTLLYDQPKKNNYTFHFTKNLYNILYTYNVKFPTLSHGNSYIFCEVANRTRTI